MEEILALYGRNIGTLWKKYWHSMEEILALYGRIQQYHNLTFSFIYQDPQVISNVDNFVAKFLKFLNINNNICTVRLVRIHTV